MSQSLAPECTPLKHAYDACFNTWFSGYLQSSSEKDAKVKEYEERCGKVWEAYRGCLEVSFAMVYGNVRLRMELKAVKSKGLGDLLERAKEENPLQDMASVDDASR